MNFTRNGICIMVILCIQAVLCVVNSNLAKEKKKNPRNNFKAIEELVVTANRTREEIQEIITPVITTPRENTYETIERQRLIEDLRSKITVVKRENKQLEVKKNTFKQHCDSKVRQLTEVFNRLSSVRLDLPVIKLWQRRLKTSISTEELVIKASREVTVFVSFLELKKMVLIGDINLMGFREKQLPECQEYRFLLAEEQEVGVQMGAAQPSAIVKTGAIGVRSAVDMIKTPFERKKISLDVKLEKESYQNRELKEFIDYYVGYCSRTIESLNKSIEHLRLCPTGEHTLDNLKNEVTVIETEIVEKKGQLELQKDYMLRLVAEVQELQLRYDALQDAADCFLDLVRFHVDDAVAHLAESIVATERRTYRQEERETVLSEGGVIPNPGPNDFLPPGPAFVDLEPEDASGDLTEEDSEFDNPGLDSWQRQEHIMPATPPFTPYLKVLGKPIKFVEPKRESYSPPILQSNISSRS